jgi:predicted phage terminase large subunit-like protein
VTLQELIALRKRAANDLFFLMENILEWKFFSREVHKKVFCPYIEAGDTSTARWRLLLAPRGHGKTSIFTVANTVRLLLKYPGISIGICHAKRQTACAILSDIKAIFESNQLLKAIAPDVCFEDPKNESSVWREHEITIKRKKPYRVPSVVAFSIDSSVVGYHFDVIILDDTVIDKNSETQEQLDQVKVFYKTLNPLLKVRGMKKVFIVGTRWHYDDAYGMLLNDEGEYAGSVEKLVLAAIKEDGTPLWPEAFTLDLLEKIKSEGSHLFWANYMNSPVPGGTRVFRGEDFQRYDVLLGSDGKLQPLLPERDRDGTPLDYLYFTSVDPNCDTNTANDYAVVLTACRDWKGNIYVVDMDRGHPSGPELVQWIKRHNQRWNPRKIIIETIQFQKTIKHWLMQDTAETGIIYRVEDAKHGGDKTKGGRIIVLQGPVESHKVFIPKGSKYNAIIAEAEVYVPGAAKHDDILDCLADVYTQGYNPAAPRSEDSRPKPPTNIGILRQLSVLRKERSNGAIGRNYAGSRIA